jgi:hypothetical protein
LVLEDVPVDVAALVELVPVLVLLLELELLLEAVLLLVEVELPGSCQWVNWTSSANGLVRRCLLVLQRDWATAESLNPQPCRQVVRAGIVPLQKHAVLVL